MFRERKRDQTMPLYHPQEIDLCRLILSSKECADLEVQATMGLQAGVLVTHRRKATGFWFAHADTLVFQFLPRREIKWEAATVQEALMLLIKLAARGELVAHGPIAD